jgi:manganese efflux pump family protein
VPRLVLFILPLSLDTFAVSAVLGIGGLSARERLRASLLFAGFETAMPVVGVLLGHGLGHLLGHPADYLASVILIALGCWMLFQDEGDERSAVQRLAAGRGLALVALGLAVSLDELAIGFTIGLLHLSLWLAIVLIGAQAFVVAQLGLRLGARLGERVREGAERLAAVALIGLGILVLVEELAR